MYCTCTVSTVPTRAQMYINIYSAFENPQTPCSAIAQLFFIPKIKMAATMIQK